MMEGKWGTPNPIKFMDKDYGEIYIFFYGKYEASSLDGNNLLLENDFIKEKIANCISMIISNEVSSLNNNSFESLYTAIDVNIIIAKVNNYINDNNLKVTKLSININISDESRKKINEIYRKKAQQFIQKNTVNQVQTQSQNSNITNDVVSKAKSNNKSFIFVILIFLIVGIIFGYKKFFIDGINNSNDNSKIIEQNTEENNEIDESSKEIEQNAKENNDITTDEDLEEFKTFSANIYFLSKAEGGLHTPSFGNKEWTFKFNDLSVEGKVTKIKDGEAIFPGESREVEISLDLETIPSVEFEVYNSDRLIGRGSIIK